jgi:uncharacterized Fe-S cluster protein YjdI
MENVNETKQYSNDDITIVWKPTVCAHAAICWRGENALPEVFNPKLRPWININGSNTERIMEQVNRCPSGALSYFKNKE